MVLESRQGNGDGIMKEIEEIVGWLDTLPQAYDNGLTDIGKGNKTWDMFFNKTQRLKELLKVA